MDQVTVALVGVMPVTAIAPPYAMTGATVSTAGARKLWQCSQLSFQGRIMSSLMLPGRFQFTIPSCPWHQKHG